MIRAADLLGHARFCHGGRCHSVKFGDGDVLCGIEIAVRDVHQYIGAPFLGIGSNTGTQAQAHHQSQTDQLFHRILLVASGNIMNRVLSCS